MVERGPYVSYANCGLPYHVGGRDRARNRACWSRASRLFRGHFAIDVRTNCEAVEISAEDEDGQAAQRRDRRDHDAVLRQAGARRPARRRSARRCPASTCPASSRCAPFRTRGRSASGSSAARRSSPACTATRASRSCKPKRRAVVVGGGFIGLEMAENLVHRGFDVTLVEMLDQVLPPLDPEIARARRGAPASGTACAWRSATAWPASQAAETARSRSRTKSGQALPGRPRDPRARRAARHRAREGGRPRDRRARRHPRRRPDAHERPRHLRRRRRRRGAGTSSPASGASSRSPAPPTGRAGSPPT